MLKRFELGHEAIAYIRDCLIRGHTLSSLLLRLPLEDGRVFTYLPADAQPRELSSFKQSVLARRWENNGRMRETANFIRRCLASPKKQCAVFEDISRPGDPALQAQDEEFFMYQSEVYDFLLSGSWGIEKILATITRARQYPLLGVLTNLPAGTGLHHRDELGIEALRMMADNTRHLIVGAYDETADLIWTREYSIM